MDRFKILKNTDSKPVYAPKKLPPESIKIQACTRIQGSTGVQGRIQGYTGAQGYTGTHIQGYTGAQGYTGINY